MKTEQKLINFEDGQLLGVKTEDGEIYLGVKKACLDIGLSDKQADRQVANIQEDLVLKTKSLKIEVIQKEGTRHVKRQIVGLHEDLITLWLAKISLTPKMKKENSKAVAKLVNYQLKAAKVLHEAFSLEDIKEELGLKGEIVDLKKTIGGLENKIDTMDSTMGALINSATINSYQAKQLNKTVRERISTILGGAHSSNYKRESRMYFKNLWLNLCDKFSVSEYRDLNPLNYDNAITYIQGWSMK